MTTESPVSDPGAAASRWRAWVAEWDEAHRYAVAAASAGLADPALGGIRLAGDALPILAEAAVSSATPYLRAPLLARLQAAAALHLPERGPGPDLSCPQCGTPSPCETLRRLRE